MSDPRGAAKSGIQCSGVTKRYGATIAVAGATLDVDEGKTLALLGPSGCGKTTLLRLIAGFESPDSGTISIRGREVVGPGVWVPPERRQIGFVFQDYALFPHLSVGANIAYGLRKLSRAERRRRVDEMLALVGLEVKGDSMPHELSGGQQQRVALARALGPAPDVVLLDEPFSNLDAALRLQVREELKRILERAGATAIFVTHDREEALNLGAKVAVMHQGVILEAASPRAIYLQPKSMETARIVGAVNMLPGESSGVTVRCALGTLPVAHPCRLGPMEVMMRPESIEIRPAAEATGHADGTIVDLQYHGNHQHVRVRLAGGEELRVKVGPAQIYKMGQRVSVRVPEPVTCYSRNESGRD